MPVLSPAGSLLIAHPGLRDPNFFRTVLFISQSDPAEGAFGLILNRPSGRVVADLLPDRDDLGPLGQLPVFLGGPVGRDQLIFAAFEWDNLTQTLECRHHVALGEAIELLHAEQAVVRPYIGYAGWGKGQLEGELALHSWFLKAPEPNTLDLENVENLWRNLVASFGPKYRLIADAPENPSLN
jgi:putative transcriptional regulator